MKDRIRKIMESQHMTQQVFAQTVELSPATLSSIFNGRTNPTLNIVEAIKKKIPNINTDWLLFGTGDMFLSPEQSDPEAPLSPEQPMETMLDFDNPPAPTPQSTVRTDRNFNSVKPTRSEIVREEVKIVDKPQRRVMEIRVFYDDQTWETFVPAKK